MNNNQHDNPTQYTAEQLLRYLDSGPREFDRQRSMRVTAGDAGEPYEPVTFPTPCPQTETYMELATGAIQGREAEALLTHAAECGRCGSVLAMSLGSLEGNPSEEELAALAQLAAVRTEWQQALARKLAATKTGDAGRRHSFRWAGAAAVAALVLLAAGFWTSQQFGNTPERQLAMAYEQARNLELRLPQAGYAALNPADRQRGAAADNEPAPLLDARARLARELKQSPQDAHWLELQARADLLEEHYDSATAVLDRLVAQGPVTADLLADAAAAYYQRGLVSHSELDRSTALDYLRRADELAPADPVILFNEAIVMEDRGQMMNAVEVWNRFNAVEHDPKWAAEGKRKLDALEQTLNRLKSHQSRIDEMLASPRAMDALAGNTQQLASLDEELSSYELDKLLRKAYPAAGGAAQGVGFAGSEARGSPCNDACMAARRLLKALSRSLEIQHHDYWLTDLLSPDPDSLPPATASMYVQALLRMGAATRADETGSPADGETLARAANQQFERLSAIGAKHPSQPALALAAGVGEQRETLELMYALQRDENFRACRGITLQLEALQEERRTPHRYPWMETVRRITEDVCDDTPETRPQGRKLLSEAESLAARNHYRLLASRIQLRRADDAQNAGDDEAGYRIALGTLRGLIADDVPTLRLANTLGTLPYMERDAARPHVEELSLREVLQWWELMGSKGLAAGARMDLAEVEMHIGALAEAQKQLLLAQAERNVPGPARKNGANFSEYQIMMANALLERGDLNGAEHSLDAASANLSGYSDSWGLRTFAAARGQLELAQGHLPEAVGTLESEIRNSEGRNVHRGDPATVAEYAQQDHDLYAELAAAWLAQGRTPESVLALWERFRLRSRGLPIAQCVSGALDCEQTRLKTVGASLGGVLIGQILLPDRVLVYRLDRNGVTWTQKTARRQDVLDSAENLERAISSPFTTEETAARLGATLSALLLPSVATGLPEETTLLLEPDPMIENLAWPVLPVPAGPLGLQYPLAEVRSILAVNRSRAEGPPESQSVSRSGSQLGSHALIVGASVAAGDEPPLPDALREAANVDRLLHAPELLLGEDANAAKVARWIGTAGIFHFAGHAVQTQDGTHLLLAASLPHDSDSSGINPAGSHPNLNPGSLLDPNPWIDGAFLHKHPPHACRLAVLSACATGKREASWSHPMQNMVETFASLGVPDVVATRWQIDSQATVPFMDAFYTSLSEGKSVAVALTSARRVQFGKSLLNNPYYWGAYYLTGGETGPSLGELHARL